MSEYGYYPQIDSWNYIIDKVLADDYLCGDSGVFTNTRDSTIKKVYTLPLNAINVSAFPALSISFEDENNMTDIVTERIEGSEIVIKFQCAWQDASDKVGIENTFKRLTDVQRTIQKNDAGLGNLCRDYNFEGIKPVKFYPEKSLWTIISEMRMLIRFSIGGY
tara:strand:- start:10601 stop:11089 length:489 start_codon:yes stop_codon:yes gene_type:complete